MCLPGARIEHVTARKSREDHGKRKGRNHSCSRRDEQRGQGGDNGNYCRCWRIICHYIVRDYIIVHQVANIGFIHSNCCIVCCHLSDTRKPCIEKVV